MFIYLEVRVMKKLLSAAVCAVLALSVAFAADAVKSGPQKGEKVPGPFHPLNVTGDQAGKKFCLFCVNGDNPVAMIFARETSAPLSKLIKQVDGATQKNADAKMGSFVVFLNSDSEKLEKELKGLAAKQELKKCVLSIDNPAGPEEYKVSKDADVTVVLYKERKVLSNYAFKKGELKDKDIEKIVSDISTLVK
jgi:hypothetical protein